MFPQSYTGLKVNHPQKTLFELQVGVGAILFLMFIKNSFGQIEPKFVVSFVALSADNVLCLDHPTTLLCMH